jgi:hypothetical protein
VVGRHVRRGGGGVGRGRTTDDGVEGGSCGGERGVECRTILDDDGVGARNVEEVELGGAVGASVGGRGRVEVVVEVVGRRGLGREGRSGREGKSHLVSLVGMSGVLGRISCYSS